MALHSPCKDCPDRRERCHSGCEKYKLYQQQTIDLNHKRAISSGINSDFMEHLFLSKRRMRENRGHLKKGN